MKITVNEEKNSSGQAVESPLTALQGRELDAAIAERVTGLVPCDGWVRMNFGSAGGAALRKECEHENGACYPTVSVSNVQGNYDGVPPYSRKIESAMLVVEKMRERGYGWTLKAHDDSWRVDVYRLPDNGYDGLQSQASTLPESICRAALATVNTTARLAETDQAKT